MVTRDPGASFDTPNVVIGRQGRNELTLSFRPAPYLHRLLGKGVISTSAELFRDLELMIQNASVSLSTLSFGRRVQT